MAINPLYPYQAPKIFELVSISLESNLSDLDAADIKNNADKIAQKLPQGTISEESLVTICELVSLTNTQAPIDIRIKRKREAISLALKRKLTNSIIICPSKNNRRIVYISLRQRIVCQSYQNLTLKKVVMLEFDESARLIRSDNAVREIVKLSFPLDAVAKRRVALMNAHNSPYFPTNFGFTSNDKKVSIYQEKAPCDLFDFITKNDTLSQTTIVRLIEELLHAALDLQNSGTLHRDIKPENILLFTNNNEEHLKLTDFGFACSLKDIEALKIDSGSPQWAAPEILRNAYLNGPETEKTTASDMWAIGLVSLFICKEAIPSHQTAIFKFITCSCLLQHAGPAIELATKKIQTPADIAAFNKHLEALSLSPDTALDQLVKKYQALLKSREASLNSWNTAINTLAKPPTQISNLQDLITCMLQSNPQDRITPQDALTALQTLKTQLFESPI